MIKAGIFDVGGVLLTGSTQNIHRDIMDTLEIKSDVFNVVYHELMSDHIKGIIDENQFWKLFVEKTGTKKPLPEVSFFERNRNGWKQNDELLSFVRELKKTGLRVAILSNVITAFTHDPKKKGGIYEHFEEVILSCDIGMVKPDPEIYIHTLAKLKVRPEEAFFVDDMERNIVAAQKLGIHAFQYVDIKTLKKI